MKNGVFLPVVGKAVYVQAFEEFPISLEDALQGADHQRFSETPGTRDEEDIVVLVLYEIIQIRRLVNVDRVPLNELGKIIIALVDDLHIRSSRMMKYFTPTLYLILASFTNT